VNQPLQEEQVADGKGLAQRIRESFETESDTNLEDWIQQGVRFALSLPAK